jgi:uracil-DNA glycosylase
MMENNWSAILRNEFEQPYFQKLAAFLKREYATKTVFPPRESVFSCFGYTDYADLKVVLIGQDPYHQPGQAHGCCFSVRPGVPLPPSLQNIYKELSSDLNIPVSTNGCLVPWAKQGVLLLNTLLSVEEGRPLSHKDQGWEIFTDHILERCNAHPDPLVFILWGRNAQDKAKIITDKKHLLIRSPHPSPLSAYNGFFGSKPFSQTNDYLIKNGRKPIDWRIEHV